jgi:hypothetical protein
LRGSRAAVLLDEASAVVVRHALFFILLIYSVSKLARAQFRLPFAALDLPLGDAGGYALTWRFFGYAYGYEVFIASGQLIGAALLLYWRTTTLGACILVAVLANIVVVNCTHNLPVKLVSTCYLLMASYLVAPDLRRLSALFVENKPFGARQPPDGFGWPRSPRGLVAVKATFVAVSVIHAVRYVHFGDSRPTPISGAWTVATGADPDKGPGWRIIYFERGFVDVTTGADVTAGSVRAGDERSTLRFRYEIDPGERRLRMEFTEPNRANDFLGTYELAPDGTCLLRGTRGSQALALRLVRKRP